MAEQLNAQILTQATVTAIDSQHQALYLAEKQLHYSQLILAWGAEPIQLPIAGEAAEHIFSINNLADYTRFYQALQTARHVTIMGAGLIGCEFANDLRLGGFEVSVVDPMTYVLNRLVPEAIGQVLQTALAALGITFFLRKAVKKIAFAAERYQLILSDNSTLLTDVVLSAVGLRPRIALATTAGLAVEQGIVVDRYLKTSAENIYALGDCAQVEGLVLPFVMPLMQAARALAQTLTGHPTPVYYPTMPIVVKTPA
jgi:rubredoxin-NAD+ reductase